MEKKVHRLATVCAAALLGASLSAPALAQQAPQPSGPFARLLKCLSIVDLSDAQKADVRKAFEAAAPAVKALHDRTVADRATLKATLEAAPQDPCAIGAAVVTLEGDRAAWKAVREKVKADLGAILTADQRAKLSGCLEAPKEPSLADDVEGE